MVFQESRPFFRTIEENLRVGRPEATEEEMVEAARQTQAHYFILRQPQGYRTRIGERGSYAQLARGDGLFAQLVAAQQ